jgi:hypothetical protein
MSFLAGDGSDVIRVPLSAGAVITVSKTPLLFESPVKYQIVEEQPEVELAYNDDAIDAGLSEEDEEV